MIESRCGLLCSECSYREPCKCGGCVETNGHPFHGECPVATCCQGKGYNHCGQCPDMPCKQLYNYSYDGGEHSDNPPGARLEILKKWAKTVNFEHNNIRPEVITEDWQDQFKILPWMAYVSAIPHIVFMVTTLKDDGIPNAALQGWSSFTGEGDNYFVIMSGIMKHTHTYHNIKRDKEFCINFLSADHIDNCNKSIINNEINADEIAGSGFTSEESISIKPPRIKESFLRLECEFEWEKELCPNSFNITICGKVKHISVNENFAKSDVAHRYGKNSFVFHLMAMNEPYSGKRISGGIGSIELTSEKEL